MERHGIDGLRDDLREQREFLRGRVPVYEHLLDAIDAALDADLGDALAGAWSQRRFVAFFDRPLLLLAALRYDALAEGPVHPLYDAVAADTPEPAAITTASLAAATDRARSRFWTAVATRTVQTNETSRAVAWLWPARRIAAAAPGRLVALVDLGTSAGLNLVADDLPRPWTDGAGAPLEIDPLPTVVARVGIDVAPLDPREPDSARWLRASVWPGQRARLARLDLAIERFRARAAAPSGAPRIVRATLRDAVRHLRDFSQDTCVLAFQTIVRAYLSPDERIAYEGAMRDWIASRPVGRAVWIELEVDAAAADPDRSAVLTACLREPDVRVSVLPLARTHPHPERLWVDEDGVRRFSAAASANGP